MALIKRSPPDLTKLNLYIIRFTAATVSSNNLSPVCIIFDRVINTGHRVNKNRKKIKTQRPPSVRKCVFANSYLVPGDVIQTIKIRLIESLKQEVKEIKTIKPKTPAVLMGFLFLFFYIVIIYDIDFGITLYYRYIYVYMYL